MTSPVGERFSEFFDKWICQLDGYLQQLVRVSREGLSESEHQTLVSKLTAHYKEYYTVKWAAAHEDVLVFYCPVWLSKLENACSWLTGWKPSMIFGVVESMRRKSVAELTEEQVRKIEQLRVKIKLEEEKVEREMERQQVAMADRKVVELVRTARRIRNEELVVVVGNHQVEGLVEVALKGVLAGLERVMKAADCVRLKALKGVLDVLNPSQSLDFLAGVCMLQIQIRKWGQNRDNQKGSNPIILGELHNNVIF
ncbi:hypothetical protein Golob_003383 [Gossypium lobatum]|uniref:DOG1 domain-containing protein n=1 Tax=Gossypium lobatum TaxID=34289 RepID=A0A7J8MY25_9ROSI|nr:hypothetical protein [Gossypium lobatum]